MDADYPAKGGNIPCRFTRLARAYKSRDGEWRETPSFRESDIPKAIVALQKAYEFLVMEAKRTG